MRSGRAVIVDVTEAEGGGVTTQEGCGEVRNAEPPLVAMSWPWTVLLARVIGEGDPNEESSVVLALVATARSGKLRRINVVPSED